MYTFLYLLYINVLICTFLIFDLQIHYKKATALI